MLKWFIFREKSAPVSITLPDGSVALHFNANQINNLHPRLHMHCSQVKLSQTHVKKISVTKSAVSFFWSTCTMVLTNDNLSVHPSSFCGTANETHWSETKKEVNLLMLSTNLYHSLKNRGGRALWKKTNITSDVFDV